MWEMLNVSEYILGLTASLRCPQNVSVNFKLKIPHRWFIIPCCKCIFEWKERHAVFVHVSLNANELLPRPLPEEGGASTACASDALAKTTTSVWFWLFSLNKTKYNNIINPRKGSNEQMWLRYYNTKLVQAIS